MRARWLRSWLSWLVWLVGAVCALCLAAGALLVALHLHRADPVQPVVSEVLRAADRLVLGRVLALDGSGAERETLATWTLASAGYLAVATVAARLLRV